MTALSSAQRYDRVATASAAEVIGGYSTSFGWATRLLAEPARSEIRSLYALVRVADEIVDDPDPALTPELRSVLLEDLESDTLRAMAHGRSANLVVQAFAVVARRRGIGAELTGPFFASMRADLEQSTHDAASLDAYVHGSAEVIGLMCLRCFLGEDQSAYERLAPGAQRLGAAFQKVNFLRDLADDHDLLGRTYFPGLDPADFTDRQRDELLEEIDDDLRAAAEVIPELPADSRRAVRAAHDLFAELSGRLRRTPAAEIRRTRIRVPDTRKAIIVLRAFRGGAA